MMIESPWWLSAVETTKSCTVVYHNTPTHRPGNAAVEYHNTVTTQPRHGMAAVQLTTYASRNITMSYVIQLVFLVLNAVLP